MGSFKSDNAYTQAGTKEILKYFENRFDFVDLQYEKEWQIKDVDFKFINKEKKSDVRLVEIKCDRYTSGNFYIELISNNTKGTDGWMICTKSDWIAYYFTKIKKLYMLRTKSLQEWIINNRNNYPHKHPATRGYLQDGSYGVYYYSTGFPVKIETLLDELGDNNWDSMDL